MKQAEIKNLSVEDIKAKLVELRATYSKTRLAHKISPVEKSYSNQRFKKNNRKT